MNKQVLRILEIVLYKGQTLLNVAFDRQPDALQLFYSPQGISTADQA